MATTRKKAAPAKRPTTRRKRVALNPDLSTVRLVINSVENVIDSLGFWYKRLHNLRCPSCKSLGSLQVAEEGYGIIVLCARSSARSRPCGYEREVHYNG